MFKAAVIPPHSSLGLINISEDRRCALMAGITQVQGATTSTALLVKPRAHSQSFEGEEGPLKRVSTLTEPIVESIFGSWVNN